MTFLEMRLAEPILRAISAAGYEIPTPIQAGAIPPVMEGRDLLGSAQTGTGKTAAFALPILHRLYESSLKTSAPVAPAPVALESAAESTTVVGEGATTSNSRGHNDRNRGERRDRRDRQDSRGAKPKIRTLILSPTRELALQIGDSLREYGCHLKLQHTVIVGGVGQYPQVAALRRGVDILVATPGRLGDLYDQGHIDLRHIEIFVLDEADRMLDMGFLPDIRRVIELLPSERQTLMFSATMPHPIAKLAEGILRDPARITIAPVKQTTELVTQSVCPIPKAQKTRLLVNILKTQSVTRAIVFTRTKHGADRVVEQLMRLGIPADALHGNKSQNARQRTLAKFKSSRPPVLVATDVAARGIDVDDISHVINYDLPIEAETYVHRIGRTGRAGNTGIAISFCDPSERNLLRAVERETRQSIPVNSTLNVARISDSGSEERRYSENEAAPQSSDKPVLAEPEDPRMNAGRPGRSAGSHRNPIPYSERIGEAVPAAEGEGSSRPYSAASGRNRGPRRDGYKPSYGKGKPYRSREPGAGGEAPRGDRPSYQGDRPQRTERPAQGERSPQGERPPRGDRPYRGDRPQGDRPVRSEGSRTSDRPHRHERPQHAAPAKPTAERRELGPLKDGGRTQGTRREETPRKEVGKSRRIFVPRDR